MITAVELNKVSKTYGIFTPKQNRYPARVNEISRTAQVFRPSYKNYEPLVVLISITFTVDQGEIFAITGPSGSGKSTILRLLATRTLPDNGQLKIFGFDVEFLPEIEKRQINYFSFDGSFFRNLTPVENLLFLARENRMTGSETYGRICETFNHLGVSPEDQHTPLHLLSQASMILVSIASSIFSCPRLLLLDEPVSKLDQETQQRVFNVLRDLRDQFGTTIVIATRHVDQVILICDRVARLESGHIASVEYPDAVLSCITLENNEPCSQAAVAA